MANLAHAAPAETVSTCAVCPSSITFVFTQTLTLSRIETGNIIQCNYDNPPISGFSPTCVYDFTSGELIFENATCPSQAPLESCVI
ncbi:hypothetical protein CPC08DRAFT_769127 [Agrocybe pediades]|nr:hypothetical protein CPC08DRAFT_769127 [Agrocybe pediades]